MWICRSVCTHEEYIISMVCVYMPSIWTHCEVEQQIGVYIYGIYLSADMAWCGYIYHLSYLILSYPILSYLILSYLILSYLILSHLISSHLISSYLILFYLISSHLIWSHLILSYLILSYLILSYHKLVILLSRYCISPPHLSQHFLCLNYFSSCVLWVFSFWFIGELTLPLSLLHSTHCIRLITFSCLHHSLFLYFTSFPCFVVSAFLVHRGPFPRSYLPVLS